MKPAPFKYVAPSSLEQALEIMSEHGTEAKLLAGGQSLIPVMNFRLAYPTLIVDLNRVTELGRLQAPDNGELRVGAMVRQRQLEHDPIVAQRAPLVHETMPHVAHSQIRNRGTLGGSLAHADPAAELPVIMVTLRARFRLRKKGGERWVDAESFYQSLFTTALEPEEILDEIWIPTMPRHGGWAFLEFARRHGDYAQAGVAAIIDLDDSGLCRGARLVFLNVGEIPMAADRTVTALIGHAPSAALLSAGGRHPRPGQVQAPSRRRAGRASHAAGPHPRSGRMGIVSKHTIQVIVNGTACRTEVEARLLLSDFLRHELRLTGTHVGCEQGVCGACTVLFNGAPVRSCLMLAVQADGHEIQTVEGLGTPDNLHPIQAAFREAHGLQCGFCTPGFLMTLLPFLASNPNPTEEEIRVAVSGNLCRCTGYQHIVDAALLAAQYLSPDQAANSTGGASG